MHYIASHWVALVCIGLVCLFVRSFVRSSLGSIIVVVRLTVELCCCRCLFWGPLMGEQQQTATSQQPTSNSEQRTSPTRPTSKLIIIRPLDFLAPLPADSSLQVRPTSGSQRNLKSARARRRRRFEAAKRASKSHVLARSQAARRPEMNWSAHPIHSASSPNLNPIASECISSRPDERLY